MQANTDAPQATERHHAQGIWRHLALRYLERSAARCPDKVAVVDEEGSLTYGRLYGRVCRAGTTLAARGLGGRPAIVFADKGIDTLVAFLGVLAAGGCYVPVDPGVPDERAVGIARALGESFVLARTSDVARARVLFAGQEIVTYAELDAVKPDDGLLSSCAALTVDADPAYVLFTSGSTGEPKGVAVSHRAIVDFIDAFVGAFGIDADDVIGNQAPFDFDVSVKDIYGSLAVGAELVILPRRLFSRPAELMEALAAHRVTTLIWASAALCLLSRLHGLEYRDLPHVRFVMFSGEVMPLPHLERWMERLPRATFVNLYGPTECTCNCLYHVVDRARAYAEGLPLGNPFANRRVLVLDEAGHPVARPGAVGELYIGGSGIALGYVGNPARTARAFVQNPLRANLPEILYRTGDLVRVGADGELFFCGRTDNQVKLMGHRVELEEIDAAFERQPGVERCRCVFDARRERIRACFEGSAEVAELRAGVGRWLPAPLIPTEIVRVEGMPLTKNGKVDRARLLALAPAGRTRAHGATSNPPASAGPARRSPQEGGSDGTNSR
ncbi:MAG TPA: amino acid adenylation domain-containing protein [Candidatus Coprousia avicola]|nr:amino acid adenylation domain-containing protein [Candidatus Coprousia avicola]